MTEKMGEEKKTKIKREIELKNSILFIIILKKGLSEFLFDHRQII